MSTVYNTFQWLNSVILPELDALLVQINSAIPNGTVGDIVTFTGTVPRVQDSSVNIDVNQNLSNVNSLTFQGGINLTCNAQNSVQYILPDAPGFIGGSLQITNINGNVVTLDWIGGGP
jgi:hypothetical protein